MRLSGVRVPKIPTQLGWLGVAAALAPIAYGMAKKAYKDGIKRGTAKKKKQP